MADSTRIYGWPIEGLSDQPGITLHGGNPPSSPILAEEIERTVHGLDLKIADLESQVSTLTSKVNFAEQFLVTQNSEQQVSSSTTPVDTNLTFTAEAGAAYWINLRVRWSESASGGGFRAVWTAPNGSSSLRAVVAPGQDATSGPQALNTTQIRAWLYNQEILTSSAIATSTTHAWFEDMLLIAAGPGDVTFRFAQGTSASAATTLNGASFLLYRRVA